MESSITVNSSVKFWGIRNDYIDVIKGWGILLVIWGHSSSFLFNEIYAFHMPLFFFLSGCFFRLKPLEFSAFAVKKIKQLMLPFVLFYLLSCFYYWILLFATGRFTAHDLMSLKGLLPYNNNLVNTPLWFFYALFWMFLIYFLLKKYIKNDLVILLITIALHYFDFICSSKDVVLPFFIGRSLREIIYMHLGYLFYNTYRLCDKIDKGSSMVNFLYLILFIVLFCSTYFVGERMNNFMIKSFWSIVVASIGISFSLFLGTVINKSILNKIFIYLGTHTLCLFAIHLPLYEISRPISKILFPAKGILYDITSFSIVLFLSVIIGEILMLVFPRILGTSLIPDIVKNIISHE